MRVQVVICTIFLFLFSNNTFSQTSLEKLKSELNTLTKGMSAENRSFSVNNVKIHDYSTLVFYSESSHKYIYLNPYSINPNSVKIERLVDDSRGVLYEIQFTGNKIFAVSKNKYKGITDDLYWEYNSGEVRFHSIFGVSTTDRRRVQGVVDLLKEISKPFVKKPVYRYNTKNELVELLKEDGNEITFGTVDNQHAKKTRLHKDAINSWCWGVKWYASTDVVKPGISVPLRVKIYFNNEQLWKEYTVSYPVLPHQGLGQCNLANEDKYGTYTAGKYTVKVFGGGELLQEATLEIYD